MSLIDAIETLRHGDLSSLFRRVKKGSASEGALAYYGEELRTREKRIIDELELLSDERQTVYTQGRLREVRDLLRQMEKDVKIGQAAQKEM